MIFTLKFKKEDGHKIFFISDLHIRHQKLVESRGFWTVEEHDAAIINGWNSTVGNDGTVFMLGDFVLGAGEKSFEVYSGLLRDLNYKELYICPGNHHAGVRKSLEMVEPIDSLLRRRLNINGKTVHFIPNYYEIFIGHVPIVLSHYPIISFNGQRAGAIHLHGHCHGSLGKNEWMQQNFYNCRVMDVGYENVKKPISFDRVMEIMQNREITTLDHH